MYPVLNEMIYLEKKQPTYSDFSIKYNGMDLKFSVNNTAADILELCNGENSIADIVDSLTEKFNEDINKVYLFVNEFIENSVKIGNVIIRSEVSQKRELQIIGTSDYWSLDLVSIELTYTCPLNCRHCYANAGKGKFISYDLVDKILTECKEFGKPQIQLTGGETLTHPDFFRIVKKAVDNDFNVVIFTSGYIDNETIINKIMKFPRERVSFQISVDGLEEYHNRFRGRSDAFRTTENFIKKLCKMGFRVTTATCIDDQEYDELYTLVCRMRKNGVRLMRFSPLMNKGRAHNIDKKICFKNDIQPMIAKLAMEFNSDEFRVLYFEEGEENINFKYKNNCGLGQNIIRVAPNGDVYPCLLTNIKYSNVKNEALKEIQKKYSRLWEKVYSPAEKICKDCVERKNCGRCVSMGLDKCDKNESFFLKSISSISKMIGE